MPAGGTSSTKRAALSHRSRAPQLAQKRRRLQLKATNFSRWHSMQRMPMKRCSSRPHFQYASNSPCTKRGRVPPLGGEAVQKGGVVLRDDLVQQGLFGTVALVARPRSPQSARLLKVKQTPA